MTIDQAVESLVKEQQDGTTSRFPCRAIMVKNIGEYCELLEKLQEIPGIQKVRADELFSSADVMPRYENLQDERYRDSWLILPGVSEYLRLFIASEASSQRFAKLWSYKAPSSSKCRIIIPLWGCEAQWHDKSLHLCDDVRQEPCYYDCIADSSQEQHFDLVILSGKFEQYVSRLSSKDSQICIGLQEWYEYWSAPVPDREDMLLLTGRYSSVHTASGSVAVTVIKDEFSFVRENLEEGKLLTRENCPPEAQKLLFESALSGCKLDLAILRALNMAAFSGADILNKWDAMSSGQRQLALLWFELHPDSSYICHSFVRAESIDNIPRHMLLDIFRQGGSHPEWMSEYFGYLNALSPLKDNEFYEELGRIPDYEERLTFLTVTNKQDRTYLLRMVGEWMRYEPEQVRSCEALSKTYPRLAAYLGCGGYDVDLGRYFALYKTHKLANTLPEDEELYFSDLNTEVYDYRYAVMSGALTDSCVVLWVDAMGAEWLPLLLWTLGNSKAGTVKDSWVAQATLPTETHFNEQWEQIDVPYKKLDRLDKLAHKGVTDEPDYYTCIEEQLEFVAELARKAEALFETYHRVIITADHGTSRLAARLFHKRDGLPAPKGAKVYSHGRYCGLDDAKAQPMPNQAAAKDAEGNRYIVFKNYDHFTQPGFAAGADDDNATYGEIHGGATPEEALVPVIVFESNKALPLSGKWQINTVKISAKKVKATLNLSKPAKSLQAKAGSVEGECSPTADGKCWSIVFRGISPGTYSIMLAADGSLVSTEPLTVLPALGGGDGDLL